MKNLVKLSLPVLALTFLAPLAGSAQTFSCPGGATPVTIPGYGTYCPAQSSVPEIGASASVGGSALLLCGVVMLRRRRKVEIA